MRIRRTWLGIPLAALVLSGGSAQGNGWEHTAVPFEALLQALTYEEPGTRARAAESLGYRGQPAAVLPLLSQLEKEDDPTVRSAIYGALGSLGDQEARHAIFRCLDEEDRPELRADCAGALARMQSITALRRLLVLLDPAEPLVVRARAVDAIGSYRRPEATAALTRMVRSPPPDDPGAASLRLRAITALGRTGSPEAVKPLLEALDEAETPTEQLTILRALVPVATPDARAPLQALLQRSDHPRVRTEATVALAATEATDLRASLQKLLTDAVPAVQLAAVQGLARLGERDAAPALASHADGLLRQLTGRGVEAMVADPALTIGEASLLEASLRAMVELDARSGLTTLIRAAERVDVPREGAGGVSVANAIYQVRRTALHGLGYTGAKEASETLLGPLGIGDPDPRLRAVAARSLAMLGETGATDALIGLLDDPAPEVRWAAAEALGSLAEPQAAAPLSRVLVEDAHEQVRAAAARALGWLGDPASRDALAKVGATDDSETVRRAAMLAQRQLRP